MKKIIKQIVEYVKQPHNVHLCGLPSKRFSSIIGAIREGGFGRGYKIVEIDMKRLLVRDASSRWNLGVRLAKECGRQLELELGDFIDRRCETADDFRDSLDVFKLKIQEKLKACRGIVFLWSHFDQILAMDADVRYDLYCALSPLIMDSEAPMIVASYISLANIQRIIGFGDNTDLAGRFNVGGMVWVKPDEAESHEAVNAIYYDRWRKMLQDLSDAMGHSYADVIRRVAFCGCQVASEIVKDELRGYGLIDGDGVTEWARNLFVQDIVEVGCDKSVKKRPNSGGRSKREDGFARMSDGTVMKNIKIAENGQKIIFDKLPNSPKEFRITNKAIWEVIDSLLDKDEKIPFSSEQSKLFKRKYKSLRDRCVVMDRDRKVITSAKLKDGLR